MEDEQFDEDLDEDPDELMGRLKAIPKSDISRPKHILEKERKSPVVDFNSLMNEFKETVGDDFDEETFEKEVQKVAETGEILPSTSDTLDGG